MNGKRKSKTHGPKDFAEGVGRALSRAAKDAQRTARIAMPRSAPRDDVGRNLSKRGDRRSDLGTLVYRVRIAPGAPDSRYRVSSGSQTGAGERSRPRESLVRGLLAVTRIGKCCSRRRRTDPQRSADSLRECPLSLRAASCDPGATTVTSA
jgi:hypothetical protein